MAGTHRNSAARAELSPVGAHGWRLTDAKAATTRKRRSAKLARPGTLFTSDPQSYNGSYSYTGTTRAH